MDDAAVALVLALLAPAAGFAQPPAVPVTESGPQALATIDATWNTLRLKPDVEALDRLLLDDWLLTHSDGRVQSKREYLDELRTRTRANQAIANEDVAVRIHGDTGVVTGTSVQSGTSNGQPFEGRFRFTRVWVREKGAWRMAGSHSSRMAPTPPRTPDAPRP